MSGQDALRDIIAQIRQRINQGTPQYTPWEIDFNQNPGGGVNGMPTMPYRQTPDQEALRQDQAGSSVYNPRTGQDALRDIVGQRNATYRNSQPQPGPFDWMNPELPQGTPEGLWLAEHGDWLGRGAGTVAGLMTGIPVLPSQVGKYFGENWGNDYINSHQFSTPVNIPPSAAAAAFPITQALADPFIEQARANSSLITDVQAPGYAAVGYGNRFSNGAGGWGSFGGGGGGYYTGTHIKSSH